MLTNLLGALAALDPVAAMQRKAESDAVEAPRARDTAWGVLKNWMIELRETARSTFRYAPEQARKVDCYATQIPTGLTELAPRLVGNRKEPPPLFSGVPPQD